MKRHVKSNTTSLHFTEDVFRCNLRSFVFNVSKLMITMMMRKRMQFKVSCKKGSKVSGKSSCRSTDKEFKVDKLRRRYIELDCSNLDSKWANLLYHFDSLRI